jgi:antitoxin MazE
MAIVKKLTKIGNSSALVLDRPILALLGINNETPVEISIGEDGKSLVIRQVSDEPSNRKLFKQALKDGNKRYGGAMKKLASK